MERSNRHQSGRRQKALVEDAELACHGRGKGRVSCSLEGWGWPCQERMTITCEMALLRQLLSGQLVLHVLAKAIATTMAE